MAKYNASLLIDRQFGDLTVIQAVTLTKCLCQCTCGGTRVAYAADLLGGKKYVSCGCKRRLGMFKNGHSLGGKRSLTAASYKNAKSRCNNPTNIGYSRYGGRGIEFRFQSIEELIADIGPRLSKEYSLDRKDTNGHYEIGNVKWSTAVQQLTNTTRSIHITWNGVTQTLGEWAVELGIASSTAGFRFHSQWCVQCLLFNPPFQGCAHIPEEARAANKLRNVEAWKKRRLVKKAINKGRNAERKETKRELAPAQ